MPVFQNLEGQRFGLWVVGSYVSRGPTKWACTCDCGTVRNVQAGHLKSGASTGCGCDRRQVPPPRRTGPKFKDYKITYGSWRSMRARCLCESHEDYWRYGGRGITICDRWSSFWDFLTDMGERPSPKHSIDRIDNDGNYEPGNCRWATQDVQVANLPQNQKGYRHKSRHGQEIHHG